MDYDEQVGKKERNPKCHNTSQVINMGSRSCAGHVQGETRRPRNGGLTGPKEQNGPYGTQTRGHKKESVWKEVCKHHMS